MPSLEASLRAHLLGDASIPALIQDATENEARLWPEERPAHNKRLPAIVYQIVAVVPQTELEGGDSCLERGRVQVDVYAKDHDQAIALRDLVIARMRIVSSDLSLRALLNFRSAGVDPDSRERRELLDFSIWHQTA
jgi:hypothetical protein